jgi:hypothetical protein
MVSGLFAIRALVSDMSWLSSDVISLFAAMAFGSMLLFMTCFAPTIFNALERLQVARLIRHIVPHCYFTLSVILALATKFLIPAGSYELEIAMFVGCAGLFLVFLNILLTRKDALWEQDQNIFNHLHRTSGLVNLAQFEAVLVTLIRLIR